MFKEISEKLKSFLHETELSQYVVRTWVSRQTTYVVDFIYRGVKFGFNIYPLASGNFLLEMIERNHKFGPVLIKTANRKLLIARSVPLRRIEEMINESVTQNIKKINAYRRAHLSAPTTSITQDSTQSVENLRIGVLTLPLNKNIGGNLQAYAMMEVLKHLGHSPVFINSKHPPSETSSLPLGSADLSQPLLTDSIRLAKYLPNSTFTDKYLAPMTVPFNSVEMLARDVGRLGLDAIIAGSDQIWRPKYSKSLLLNYFFGFLPPNSKIKRISYAASFGTSDWEFDKNQTLGAAELIKNFDAVGVREDEAIELCATHLGVNAQHVLDPTLLLDRTAYVPIISEAKSPVREGQVITYVLDATRDKVNAVRELSNTLGLKAFSTTGQPFTQKNKAEEDKGDHSVQQWLASLDKAAFVVTDSFHGVAFSILLNKPFIAYGNPNRGMSRFTSLLKMVGLEDRLVTNSSEIDIQKMVLPIDWKIVNKHLAIQRAKSFDFLKKALS